MPTFRSPTTSSWRRTRRDHPAGRFGARRGGRGGRRCCGRGDGRDRSPSLSPLTLVDMEPTRERRRLILAICCMSLLIVGLDNTIVNVALPAIGRELHATVSGLQWTGDAYTLVLASLLMLSGSMADRFGRRRVFE